MPAQGLVIACTSTPTVVAGTLGTGAEARHGYIRVRLKCLSGTAYLGDSGVTTAGYPLTSADAAIEVPVSAGESPFYAATSSGGAASLAVLRIGDTT